MTARRSIDQDTGRQWTDNDDIEKRVPTSGSEKNEGKSELSTNDPDGRNDGERSDGEASKTDDEQPPLPFSKFRCIALVATLMGASFLNVSSPFHQRFAYYTDPLLIRRYPFKASSLSCPQLARLLTFRRADSSGLFLPTRSPSVAFSCYGGVSPTFTASV